MVDFLVNNWWYILLIGVIVYRMFRGSGCCGGHSHVSHDHGGEGHHGHDNNNSNGTTKDKIDMVKDPVCGMYVYPDTAIKETVNGKTYYFCSESCRSKFLSSQTPG